MSDPRSASAIEFGVTWTAATPRAGEPYWKLLSVNGPVERGGNANIYVDVLDERGQRIAGLPVRFFWASGQYIGTTEPKPGEPDQGTNMPMSAGGNSYGVHVNSGPSDRVWGMGMVSFQPHKSWRVVFQRAYGGANPLPPVEPPVEPEPPEQMTLSYALEQVVKWAGIARRLGEQG